MNALVTGGAGYIGSHVARRLQQAGHEVWIYDNLSTGHEAAAIPGRLVQGDLADQRLLARVLAERQIDAVIHMAGSSIAGESVADPGKYYRSNVLGSVSLLEAMRTACVRQLVFSSTAATYGVPRTMPIREDAPQLPINPYGSSKLAVERTIERYAQAYGLSFAMLRYFNAAGASRDAALGEDHDPETHLIPTLLRTALGQAPAFTVFGDDYDTRDGTCVRDYIDVEDLAEAHLLAVDSLEDGSRLKLNLGSGRGYSVREVIEACREVTGRPIRVVFAPRRPGDPSELLADNRLAARVLGWTPRYSDLRTIVETAWRWHSRWPRGYRDVAIARTASAA